MAEIRPVAWQIATSLIQCFCAELAANAAEDPTLPMVSRCCLRAGSEVPMDITEEGFIAIDQCCPGEAYVKVNSIFPSSQSFPEPDAAALNTPCQMQQLAVSLEMGVFRCLPEYPDCVDSSYAVRQQAADAEAAFRAVCCWVKDMNTTIRRGTKWFAQGWENGGPEGQCLSGTMQVFASMPGPCC